MRKLIVVGSSINPSSTRLTYSEKRTFFSPEERFRQSFFTLNSLRNCFPDSKIVFVDSSENYAEYLHLFAMFKDVEFIPLKELSYDAFLMANNNTNKSACESALLNAYYLQYKKQILEYDVLIKTTGRYFYFDVNDASITHDEIYFKKPLNFEWNDSWRYEWIDKRKEQNNNKIYQYCTVMYAFGTKHLDKFIDMNEAAIHLLNQNPMHHYDIETLSYYFTRPFKDLITEVDWKVSGWDGVSGRLMYY